ncbi:hypothetical protein PSQ90_11600 [Devosia rhodophyticola]|uniref:Uncharacterized protein n=1 Tax=Devosia rhodophyticola TaxID=3026423 RepID=A0ABY7YUR7_9HYPH|nr:hypothetical protein [Devosia rhodophyticola]WDR04942.1 hypothetical protein PSQ90_11600 [Devosia rhodophyticola]
MADYKELLRRAISALPENNGAARRAVYEKARSALVGQLRAINPPLPARDITQHRLQLEDCIRQVEQEASEAVISLRRDFTAAPPPVQPVVQNPQPAESPAPQEAATAPESDSKPTPANEKNSKVDQKPGKPTPDPKVAEETRAKSGAAVSPEKPTKQDTKKQVEPVVSTPAQPQFEPDASEKSEPNASIEDIISAAEAANPEPNASEAEPSAADAEATAISLDAVTAPTPEPSPKADAPLVAEPSGDVPAEPSLSSVKGNVVAPMAEPPVSPAMEDRAGERPSAGAGLFGRKSNTQAANIASAKRVEPAMGAMERARDGVSEPVIINDPKAVESALSSEREVDVEPGADKSNPLEAEGVIERAIETLDREARGEKSATLPDAPIRDSENKKDDFHSAPVDGGDDRGDERRGAGLTIFLLVFALLLVGVGGAGFWAWREGYVDLDQMFGRSTVVATDVGETTAPVAGGQQRRQQQLQRLMGVFQFPRSWGRATRHRVQMVAKRQRLCRDWSPSRG